jgi:hypothetical protein
MKTIDYNKKEQFKVKYAGINGKYEAIFMITKLVVSNREEMTITSRKIKYILKPKKKAK